MHRGFTLLEIVISMLVISILLGSAVGYMYFSSDERALKGASGEVELLAKRARTVSVLQQTPYALLFQEGEVRLMPWAEAISDEKTTALGRDIGGSDVESPSGRAPVRDGLTFEAGMNVFIRRWNTDAWLPTGKNSIHVWRFDPDGLCEPIALRYELDGSWYEDVFHPLTASIRESFSEVK